MNANPADFKNRTELLAHIAEELLIRNPEADESDFTLDDARSEMALDTRVGV